MTLTQEQLQLLRELDAEPRYVADGTLKVLFDNELVHARSGLAYHLTAAGRKALQASCTHVRKVQLVAGRNPLWWCSDCGAHCGKSLRWHLPRGVRA